MILRFVNNIQDKVLTTYHIVIDFKTHEKKPSHYRLELLAELRSDLEKELLINQIKNQLIGKFDGCNHYDSEVNTLIDRKLIEDRFNDMLKKHVSMKFLFRQWIRTFVQNESIGWKTISVIDNTIPNNGVMDYRVNILKTGEICFTDIEDMFCVEIDTTEFK